MSRVPVSDLSSLQSELVSCLADGPLMICELDKLEVSCVKALAGLRAAVRIGVDCQGLLPHPQGLAAAFDVLLTTRAAPGREWVTAAPKSLKVLLGHIRRNVSANPIAATMLCQLLRTNEGVPDDTAFLIESLAYSTLLGGDEFRRWLRSRVGCERDRSPSVSIERADDCLHILLDDPGTGNAVTASMRDRLIEAFRLARADPSIREIRLGAAGRSFSTGGDLEEFGTASDLALAHLIRTARSVSAEIAAVADRVTVSVQGACIGAGVEMAAAAGTFAARPDALFQLPELRMGLVPGAGGTVTIPRRIGRWRTAFMALSGRPIPASTALAWGLIDRILD